jgi:transposase
MTIVMGLDQHRAQVTVEWIDTETGELARARVAPAHREGIRRFLSRFSGQELEVALEATTGWRFVVEELRAIGARVHLAEPTETAARRGRKKRPKTDRADARLLRELLMADRIPESWIPPDHLLDLRALVRLRHALVNERGEWQQRIQAVLYHHGVPQRRELLTRENRAWVEELPLPAAAREQVSVALAMIDAVGVQLKPLTDELRAYARRQAGCRALMAHYGIGELTAVVVLAELGDARRFSSSRDAVRYAGIDITVYQSDQRARAPLPPRTTRIALGALRGRPNRAAHWQPRPRLLPASRRATRRQPRLPGRDAQAAQAQLPHAARTRRRGTPTRMSFPVRAKPSHSPMRRGRLPACSCRHSRVDGPERPSGRNASPSGITQSTILSPTPKTGSRTEIRPGARAHTTTNRPHAPPTDPQHQRRQPEPALDAGPLHR